MLLETRAVQPFYKNGFVVGCEETREAVLVDPGDEVDQLLAVIHARQLAVRYILLTHGHMDHVSGLVRAKASISAPIGLHRDDLFLYNAAVQQGEMFGYQVDPPPPVDFYYEPAMTLPFGRYAMRVHHTPGHSPGGVCLSTAEHQSPSGSARDSSSGAGVRLFVGDTLFAGSIGRTDLPGGSLDTLLRSIREVLFAFGDAAEVYPGHGPKTTIGQERRTNPFLA